MMQVLRAERPALRVARTTRRTGLPRFVRAHGPGFRAVFAVDFRRHYGPTVATPEEAAAYAKTHLLLTAQGGPPEVLTIQGAVDLLTANLRETGAREGTREFYAKYSQVFLRRWGAGRALHDVDERALRGYILDRLKHVSARTVWLKEMQVAKRIFRLAVAGGYLHRDPMANLRPPKMRKPRFEAVEQLEVHRVVDAILASKTARQARLHADVVLLLFYTGLRLSEAARLRVGDYKVAGKSATLWIDGKTENRHQPVPEAIREVVDRLRAGKPETAALVGRVRFIWCVLDRCRRRLGLPHFSSHVLRHGYATAMVRLGVSPFDLQVLMGHRSITQTMRYYHASGPTLQTAADALGQLDQPQRDAPSRAGGARGLLQ